MAKETKWSSRRRRWATPVLTMAFAASAVALIGRASEATAAAAEQAKKNGAQVREAFRYPLPHMDGAALRLQGIEVRYAPGGASEPHSHPCPVIGYVLEGALRSQVEGQPEAIYKAGESFYEAAHGVHVVSASASATEPVRFLAIFVCDHDAPLSGPPASGAHKGGPHE